MEKEQFDYNDFKEISDITDEYIYSANGINVDYIIVLKKNSGEFLTKEIKPIVKYYGQEFEIVKNIYNDKDSTLENLISTIKGFSFIDAIQNIVDLGIKDNFDYCITLSDKFIPLISIHILKEIEKNEEKLSIVTLNYKQELHKIEKDLPQEITNAFREEAERKLEKAKTNIKIHLCKYLGLWILAYQLEMAYNEIKNEPDTVAFSHRRYGWAGNGIVYQVNNNTHIEFQTNFGFGNSTYFYLLMNYKGIKIFPFLDWVNYKYAEASEMKRYTHRLHMKLPRIKKGRSSPVIKVEQKDWDSAMDYILSACNLSIQDEKKFLYEYLLNPLERLISTLEEVYQREDEVLNEEYRSFDYHFSEDKDNEKITNKIKLMNVKGALITGSLAFIEEIIKLEEFMNISSYLERLKMLNLNLLPLLQETIIQNKQLTLSKSEELNNTKNELQMIWINHGLQNLEYYQKQGTLTESQYKRFKELKEAQRILIEKKGLLEQDLKFCHEISRAISNYIKNISNILI